MSIATHTPVVDASRIGLFQYSSALLARSQEPVSGFAESRKRTRCDAGAWGIQRLPTELLCAIFAMCGDTNEVFSYPRDEDMHATRAKNRDRTKTTYLRATVHISRVCSRWFAVTRGCPQLWTAVDVALPQPSDITALKLALRYSDGLPLILRIDDNLYTPPHRRTESIPRQFMELVASTAHRWAEVSIILLHGPPAVLDVIEPLLAVPRNSFVSLARATLRFEDDKHASAASRLWEALYGSPMLRAVQWFYVRVHAPALTLQQLTHIGVNAIRPEEVMGLLQACPRLEILQAIVEPAPDIYPGQNDGYLIPAMPAPIILPHLQVLMLSGMYDWSHFFEGLTVPRLNRLDLNIVGIQADAIQAMLRRSSAHLYMLTLRWLYAGNEREIVALLQSPELQNLKILRYHPYDGPEDEPDSFDPTPYLPSALLVLTRTYEDAESSYHALVTNR
ncbi:hypothetical protein BD626DRAFT_574424 [Schizophyllum amplum]|uniref:Uncharacterized protein n=1 Tax=Schizophyllum amplum TaxID=97359 RepID=A0A550BYF1_9AGAR|nr:hypothetical protein BD626DRAFT_574424 [Auriculariopsis ampla]